MYHLLKLTFFIILFNILQLNNLNSDTLKAVQYSDFDHYILALSYKNNISSIKNEDNYYNNSYHYQNNNIYKESFFKVHGLWPSLPKSIAAKGVNNSDWIKLGCAAKPISNMIKITSKYKCKAPNIKISDKLIKEINTIMFDTKDKSCLYRYEYAKHGICFGFKPDAYFNTLIRLNKEFENSAIGNFLIKNYGRVVKRKDFDLAFAKSWGIHNTKALNLICDNNFSHLKEIRIAIKANSINLPLSNKSFKKQLKNGNCKKNFFIF